MGSQATHWNSQKISLVAGQRAGRCSSDAVSFEFVGPCYGKGFRFVELCDPIHFRKETVEKKLVVVSNEAAELSWWPSPFTSPLHGR